jgi:hypothetical protein
MKTEITLQWLSKNLVLVNGLGERLRVLSFLGVYKTYKIKFGGYSFCTVTTNPEWCISGILFYFQVLKIVFEVHEFVYFSNL